MATHAKVHMATHAKVHIVPVHQGKLRSGLRLVSAPREELKAPPGKYRVMAAGIANGVGGNYLLGDFTSLRAATEIARTHGLQAKPAVIYDEQGAVLAKFAS